MADLFSDWTLEELKALKKKLEEMYFQGIRQSTFKDQTLIFASTTEIKQRLTDLTDAVTKKEVACGILPGGISKNKKQIRVSTKSKGF